MYIDTHKNKYDNIHSKYRNIIDEENWGQV